MSGGMSGLWRFRIECQEAEFGWENGGKIKQIFVILILKEAACSDIMECINMNKV